MRKECPYCGGAGTRHSIIEGVMNCEDCNGTGELRTEESPALDLCAQEIARLTVECMELRTKNDNLTKMIEVHVSHITELKEQHMALNEKVHAMEDWKK